jgi:hypothetical protein
VADRGSAAVKRLSREPLVHFFLLSAVLWGIQAHFQAHSPPARITVSKSLVARLADQYRRQYGAAPSALQLDALIDQAITEEITYREAIKLGLDRDDEIVRRRLMQKYEFLQQDLATPRNPTPEEAMSFFTRHAERYLVPERLTFSHVYFSPDRRGDAGARDAAAALAAVLNLRGITRVSNEGDPFPGPAYFVGAPPEDIARVFGRNGLSESTGSLPAGHWSPPLRSGFGWHTVFVLERIPGRQAEFDEVRDRVIADFLEEERSRRNAAALGAVRSQYEVVRE